MRRKKNILFSLLFLIALSGIAIFFCNKIIDNAARGKLYSDAADIPYNKVALLLGTGKYLANGQINAYYYYRIKAAAGLYNAKKIKIIIVSGDHGQKDYNEPAQIRSDLRKEGIDSSVIYLDYAGFRTFDSMVRLREIFSQHSVTVISQQFHNERAIYIASREGIEAIGFNAKDVSKNTGFKVKMREKLARVKVFVDYLVGTEPKFLGPKVIIP